MEAAGCAMQHHIGHDFRKRTFFQPTYCEHCSDMLWGIKGQGFVCRVCRFTCHEKCIPSLITSCPHVALQNTTEPIAHRWGKAVTANKRFCNVCRRKTDPQALMCCEVCKYYAHKGCKDFALMNCKATSLYRASEVNPITHHDHHWIEGNLTKGKCEVCMKSCSSDQCLNGMRCTWCAMMLHSYCFTKMKGTVCDFRDLSPVILVPEAVEWVGSELGSLDCSVDLLCDSPVELGDDEVEGSDKTCPVMVFDDIASCHIPMRNSTSQRLLVTKKMNAKDILDLAIKRFHIPEESDGFYLSESVDEVTEKPLHNSDIPYELATSGNIPKLVIKMKNPSSAKGSLKILNKLLPSSISFVQIPVTSTTNVTSIIELALIKFDMEDACAGEYILEQMSLDQGVVATHLDPSNCPWDDISKTNSVRKTKLTRFYLRKKVNSRYTIAVWGLPKSSLEDNKSMQEFITNLLLPHGIALDDVKFGPFYRNAKLMFVDCTTLFVANQVGHAVDQATVKLRHYILPNIYPDAINKQLALRQEPLLVFINSRSGGNQGTDLLTKFRHHLNPHQVFDISNGGPHVGLHAFRKFLQFRILIGGGDGTFGWVLSVLEETKALRCPNPPCSLLPLGTGNDLARVLSWGPGYSGEKVSTILLSVDNADLTHLDRWNIHFKPTKLPPVRMMSRDADLAQAFGFDGLDDLDIEVPTVTGEKKIVMNNYFGIGLDADIALDFHLAREENPEKFSSRFHNKGVYLQLALQKMVTKKVTAELDKHISIEVDGKQLPLPHLEGVVILNIQSWGAGAEVWGQPSDKKLKNADFGDGLFEVVGISGVMHMAQMQGALRCGIRLAQCSKCTIQISHAVSVQVDGEPWNQSPCTVTVEHFGTQAAMLKKSGRKISTGGKSSFKNLTDLRKRHTEGDFVAMQQSSRNSQQPHRTNTSTKLV